MRTPGLSGKVLSRRETKGDKPGNHDETGSSRRVTKQDPVEGRQRETNLEIMTKQDPVEGRLHQHRPQTAFLTFSQA